MSWEIGSKVEYKGEVYEVIDIDEGYDYLALGGDKYIYPNAPENRCISAPMTECTEVINT